MYKEKTQEPDLWNIFGYEMHFFIHANRRNNWLTKIILIVESQLLVPHFHIIRMLQKIQNLNMECFL